MLSENVYDIKRGGIWYYCHDRPGTEWYDKVNNEKGWTVDFNLKVEAIVNSTMVLDEDYKGGSGIYINDGKRKESITFLTQEIIFANADEKVIFDTTQETNYRLTGKKDSLKLYERKRTESIYSKIADIAFFAKATEEGNGLKPVIAKDIDGDLHVVWYDDGDIVGKIYYCKYSDGIWSQPEIITNGEGGATSPDIIIDDEKNIYVVFETKKTNHISIGFIYKNNIGWSNPIYFGVDTGDARHPRLALDYNYNLYVVWQDGRTVHPEIYMKKFTRSLQKWEEDRKITFSDYGCYRPAIFSRFNHLFISWTKRFTNENSAIEITKYNVLSNVFSIPYTVSSSTGISDYSDVLVSVNGKIVIVWHNNHTGKYQIYLAMLSYNLSVINAESIVAIGRGISKYPKLSEHEQTGRIYIVWQDAKEGFHPEYTFAPKSLDPSANPSLVEFEPIAYSSQYEEAIQKNIYIAYYNCTTNTIVSSTTGSFDVFFNFSGERGASFPSVAKNFTEDLFVLYEAKLSDTSDFLKISELFTEIRVGLYDINSSEPTLSDPGFTIDHGVYIKGEDPSLILKDRDLLLSGKESRKEIRFGDFSNTLNTHMIFKNFKYYTNDAVIPFEVRELKAKYYDNIDKISAEDAVINNYGNVWIVGKDGFMFFVNNTKLLYVVGKNTQIATSGLPSDLTKFNNIRFDKHNYLFLASDDQIYYSTEHVNGFTEIIFGSDTTSFISPSKINIFEFDRENYLLVGTESGFSILKINETIEEENNEVILKIENLYNSDSQSNWGEEVEYEVPDSGLGIFKLGSVSCISVDDNNVIWIGTHNGLYKFYKKKFLRFGTKVGMPSVWINDIAIRNTGIRYIATSDGIAKMIGSDIPSVIDTATKKFLWSNDIKCLKWQEPNVLWAGTASKINQILVDDIKEDYSTGVYEVTIEPELTNVEKNQNLNLYYIDIDKSVGLDPDYKISEKDVIDVYINGNLISFGYEIGYDSSATGDKNVVKFDCPLRDTDLVEVIIRRDLELRADFTQTDEEKMTIKNKLVRIKDFASFNNNLYVSTEGNENEVKINDMNNNLCFDRLHLDTTPPWFEPISDDTINPTGFHIGEQVNKGIIRVNINHATDGEEGSGIENMIVSNYPNFTEDGIVPQTPIPYATNYIHNLGLSLDEITTEFQFLVGYGSKIKYFADTTQEYFASSSLPAILYKYNPVEAQWEELFSYGENNYIDFIAEYNDKLIVSIGHDTELARIYVYNYTEEGNIYSLKFQEYFFLQESRAFCYQELNNIFYIGSGIGTGNEYKDGSGTAGGRIYAYDGVNSTIIVSNIDENIYDLTTSLDVPGDAGDTGDERTTSTINLIAVTGPSGFVHEIDVINNGSLIVYSSPVSLSSTRFFKIENVGYIYIGDSQTGKILKSFANSYAFNVSFVTLPGKVNVIKRFRKETLNGDVLYTLYAVVDNIVYYLSETGNWTWKYTHTENVNDITLDPITMALYIISDTKIIKIKALENAKNVYLSLIDRAGNKTKIKAEDTPENSYFIDDITIKTLRDYVNENKIIELDDFGNAVFTLTGSNSFFSADKIEEEKGIYVSEIFDGSLDLVKWDYISWQATEVTDTFVYIYVRASDSSNDILLDDWTGPFENSSANRVDLSYMSGRYLQFKIELISHQKDISPIFYRASIKAIASEAVHFFTTNFILPSRINKGILTSQKIIPVAAEIVFGLNTTNSVDWSEYQLIDENRLFNVNQIGENLRVGIKFISPCRESFGTSRFEEYGPYASELFVNTIIFNFQNLSAFTHNYHFKIIFYEDAELSVPIYSCFSYVNQDGFSADGSAISADGVTVTSGSESSILFAPPGFANIKCDTYYFVKIEYAYDIPSGEEDEDISFTIISSNKTFVTGCNTSFVDIIDFDFTNNGDSQEKFHFRIKFYENPERTNEFLTKFSGNDKTGWVADDNLIPDDGVDLPVSKKTNIIYRPDLTEFEPTNIYYLTIDAYDGSDYILLSNSFTFKARDITSLSYCGEYIDVPMVKNFGLMFELDNNQFINLNLD